MRKVYEVLFIAGIAILMFGEWCNRNFVPHRKKKFDWAS